MPTKHLCVLIPIRIWVILVLFKPSICSYWPFQGGASFVDLIYYLSLPYCHVCFLQHRWHLLGKGWGLGSIVCDVFLCFCYFPICCLETGVVHDNIVPALWLLSCFILWKTILAKERSLEGWTDVGKMIFTDDQRMENKVVRLKS